MSFHYWEACRRFNNHPRLLYVEQSLLLQQQVALGSKALAPACKNSKSLEFANNFQKLRLKFKENFDKFFIFVNSVRIYSQQNSTNSTSLVSGQQVMRTLSSCSQQSATSRKSRTLSYLHNEDILADNEVAAVEFLQGGKPPTSLFRSMSFQERRQQQTLQRTDSGRENKQGTGLVRKLSILSPKHVEVQERIRQQQQKMQQQMQQFVFSGSDMSL